MNKRVNRLRERRASSHRWQRRWAIRLGALLALAAVVAAVLGARAIAGRSPAKPRPWRRGW